MEFAGTTALVTGAASGLGMTTALALADAGAVVVGLDLAVSIAKLDGSQPVRYIATDVTDEDAVIAALATIDRGLPLRTVVNCAGIAPAAKTAGSKGPHPLELFRRTIEINLVGTFNVERLAAQKMVDETPALEPDGARGVIINTASVAGYEGQIGQAAYAASKGGVIALTITTARDLAQYGIRVNTIAPGIIDTPMLAGLPEPVRESLFKDVPFPHRLGLPSEYAKIVLFLAANDYINGETIRLDGALRMAPR